MEHRIHESRGVAAKRQNPSQQARRRRKAAERLTRSARVLVCDSDPAAARRASDEVRELGFETVALHSLADTLREATESPFDAIVLSVPTFSDEKLSLLQLLRRARPQTPLVVITSDGSIGMRARCQPMRPYYFAVRPLANDELRDALRGALAHGTTRR